jgi:hypothetical protein
MANRQLKHSEIVQVINAAAEAKVLNIDTTIRSLIEPTAASLKNIGDEVAIHVLCCNEYGLVTGATADLDIRQIRQQVESLRGSLEKQR